MEFDLPMNEDELDKEYFELRKDSPEQTDRDLDLFNEFMNDDSEKFYELLMDKGIENYDKFYALSRINTHVEEGGKLEKFMPTRSGGAKKRLEGVSKDFPLKPMYEAEIKLCEDEKFRKEMIDLYKKIIG